MKRKGEPALALACLALLAAAGCATVVVCDDRDRLWQASLLAAQEEGYRVTERDLDRGYAFGVRTVTGDNDRSEEQRFELRLRQRGRGWEAGVVVRGTPEPVRYYLTDSPLGGGRLTRGDAGRPVTEFGSASTRKPELEKRIRERTRANLAPMEP